MSSKRNARWREDQAPVSGFPPLVSIIIPAYQSDQTIAASLESICAQTYACCEIIVVDSSPEDSTGQIVRTKFPGVRYIHSPQRLMPHAARNKGVEIARGEMLIFTDPDIYAPRDWVATLFTAYQALGGVITGSLVCHGQNWIEMGMHLCKFDKWLPGGDLRPTDIAPTANLLCSRKDFEKVGGFNRFYMLSDTLISWAFTDAGIPIWFAPPAVVAHHHAGTWRQLLKERFMRGKEFAQLRVQKERYARLRIYFQMLISLVPLRLFKIMARGAGNAWQAGLAVQFLRVSPVVLSGHAAWLAGEVAGYGHMSKERTYVSIFKERT
jgi:glycosyltransferase involved in cell wall biosynthesis